MSATLGRDSLITGPPKAELILMVVSLSRLTHLRQTGIWRLLARVKVVVDQSF